MRAITVVLPAHNEESGIFQTLMEFENLALNDSSLTVFVSEDGSSDNTRAEVTRASNLAKNLNIVLSSPSARLGYSKAVQRGIQACRTELICFMDADGQCDPADIRHLLDKIGKNGIVCGFRNPRVDGKNRIVYSNLFGFFYRLLGGPKRHDPSSPFILAYTEEIRGLGLVKCHLSYGFWWEFQWRIEKLGLNISEIAINHRTRSAGITQVYTLKKLPQIVISHLIGLWRIRKELN